MILDDEPNQALPGFSKPAYVVGSLAEATGVLAIDVSNCAYRASYGNPNLATASGTFTGHVFGALSILISTLKNCLESQNWLLVFCYDGPGARAFRQKTYPEYKANREDKFNPIPDVKAIFETLPGIHVQNYDREGDDAIAWAVGKMSKPGRPLVVWSGDKDLWALLQYPGVQVYSPNKDRFVNTDDIEEWYHTRDPNRIYLAKSMFGDSDNIKGCFRLQKKQVKRSLNHPEVKDISSFLSVVLEAPEATAKTKMKLVEDRGKMERNLSVILPNTDGFDSTTVRKLPGDRDALYKRLEELECKSLLDKIGIFFGSEFTGLQREE